jgi:hypothetical protein
VRNVRGASSAEFAEWRNSQATVAKYLVRRR